MNILYIMTYFHGICRLFAAFVEGAISVALKTAVGRILSYSLRKAKDKTTLFSIYPYSFADILSLTFGCL